MKDDGPVASNIYAATDIDVHAANTASKIYKASEAIYFDAADHSTVWDTTFPGSFAQVKAQGNNSDTAAQSLATWPWRSAYSEVSPSAFLHSAFSGAGPAAEHGRSLCSTRGKDEAEDGGTHVGLASGREQDDPPTPDEAGHLGISAKDAKSNPHNQAQNSVPMASGSHEVKVNAVQSGGSSSSSSTWRGAKLPSPPPAPAPLTPIDDRAPVAAEHQQDQQAEH